MQTMKPENSSEQGDSSILIRPIVVGVTGTRQVVECLKSATPEVRHLLLNECNVIYECKACNNLFRALPNFIAHKRIYCRQRHNETLAHLFRNSSDNHTTFSTTMEQPNGISDSPLDTSNVPKSFTSNHSSPDAGVTNFYDRILKNLEHRRQEQTNCTVHLKPVDSRPDIMFQNVVWDNKQDTNSLEESSQNVDDSRIVDVIPFPDAESGSYKGVEDIKPPINLDFNDLLNTTGFSNSKNLTQNSGHESCSASSKLAGRTDCDVSKLKCLRCNTVYSSIKTLQFHMGTIHADKRILYSCIYCLQKFTQVWGVTRHMMRAHNKTKEQVNKVKKTIRLHASVQNQAEFKTQGIKTESSCVKSKKDSPKKSSPLKVNSPSDKSLKVGHFELHRCKLCTKVFGRSDSLKRHLTYYCEGKQFTKESKLPKMDSPGCQKSPGIAKKIVKLDLDVVKKEIKGKDVKKLSPKSSCAKSQTEQVQSNRPKRIITVKKRTQDFIDSSILALRLVPKDRVSSSSASDHNIDTIINVKKLECLSCGCRFLNRSNLRRHAVRHFGWKRFKCKFCSYMSYNRSECRCHINKIHHAKKGKTDIDKLIIDLESEKIHPAASIPGSTTPVNRSPQRSLPGKLRSGLKSNTPPSSLPCSPRRSKEIWSPNTSKSIRRSAPSSPSKFFTAVSCLRSSASTSNIPSSQKVDMMATLFTRSGMYPKTLMKKPKVEPEEVVQCDVPYLKKYIFIKNGLDELMFCSLSFCSLKS